MLDREDFGVDAGEGGMQLLPQQLELLDVLARNRNGVREQGGGDQCQLKFHDTTPAPRAGASVATRGTIAHTQRIIKRTGAEP